MQNYKEKAISEKYRFLKFLQKQKSYQQIQQKCSKCGCPISVLTSTKRYYMEFAVFDFTKNKLYCPECTENIIFYTNKIGMILLSHDHVKIDYAPKRSVQASFYPSFFKNNFHEVIERIKNEDYEELSKTYKQFCKINTFCIGV